MTSFKENAEKHPAFERVLFHIAFVMYIMYSSLGSMSLREICGIEAVHVLFALQGIAVFFLLLKVVVQQKLSKIPLLVLVLLLLTIPSAIRSGVFTLPILLLFLVAASGISMREIALTNLIITGIFVMLILLLCITGNLTIYYGDSSITSSYSRINSNYLGAMVLSVVCSYAVIRESSYSFRDSTLILLIGFFVLFGIEARTAGICIVIASFLFIIRTRIRNDSYRKISLFIILILVTSFVLISYWIMLAYSPGNSILVDLNEILSWRLWCANYYYTLYPPSLLFDGGINGNRIVVDNAYCYLLIRLGVISALSMIGIVFCSFLVAFRRNYYSMVIFALFVFCIMGLGERYLFTLSLNPFILVASSLFYPSTIPSSEE